MIDFTNSAYLVDTTKTQYLIGFANEFYTLWIEKEITYKLKDDYTNWRKDWEYKYIQNLSKDEATAILKAKDKGATNLEVDIYLRGESSNWKYISYPEHTLQFGKYVGQQISEVIKDDLNYIIWYGNTMLNKESFRHKSEEQGAKYIIDFLNNSPLVDMYNDKFYDTDYVKEKKNEARRLKARAKKALYFGEVGTRVKNEKLKLSKRTYFEGFYGTTYVFTFIQGAYTFVYMGSSALQVEEGESIDLSFTIKDHSEYNGLKQTKISRPKIN